MTGRHPRDYYRASAPPRSHQPATGLPATGPDARREGRPRDGSHVHHAIDQPVRRPALPRQHRHAYAAGIQRGLPTAGTKRLRSREPATGQDPCAAHRPVSARFENGFAVTGRLPLVRSRCTFWPRSTSPHRLAVPARPAFVRGRLRPAPASPGTGCPSASPDRCDGPMVKVSHLHSIDTAPRGAQFPREIRARRLQNLIRPPEFPVLPFQLGDLLPIRRRRSRPLSRIDLGLLTQVRKVSRPTPSWAATRAMAPFS
jgi:hypothetical protein